MVNAAGQASPPLGRYGPVGLVAALLNTGVVEFVTWMLLPWFYLAIFLIPVLLLDLAVAAVLTTRRGTLRHIGWGMMIGCISGPAALVFFIPLYFVVQSAGLV